MVQTVTDPQTGAKTQYTDDGAAHVSIPDSNLWIWPNTLYTNGAATGAAASTIYTSPDVSMYDEHIFDLYTLTATSLDVHISVDGTNFVGPVRCIDLGTGVVHTGNPLTAVGRYKLEGKFKNICLIQVGINATAVRYAHYVRGS